MWIPQIGRKTTGFWEVLSLIPLPNLCRLQHGFLCASERHRTCQACSSCSGLASWKKLCSSSWHIHALFRACYCFFAVTLLGHIISHPLETRVCCFKWSGAHQGLHQELVLSLSAPELLAMISTTSPGFVPCGTKVCSQSMGPVTGSHSFHLQSLS